MTSNPNQPWRTARAVAGGASQLLRAREMRDFALGEERIDLRGWPVYSHDARLVGLVDAFFVDPRARVVRYIGITLAEQAGPGPSGIVLIPVGAAARTPAGQGVVLNAISAAQVAAAPRVGNRPVTRADEDAALAVFGMATSRDLHSADLYSGPNFDEQRLFG